MPELTIIVAVLVLIGAAPMVTDIAAGDAITPEHGPLWRLELIGEVERAYLRLNSTQRALFWLACAEERLNEMKKCIGDPEHLKALAHEYRLYLNRCLSESERANRTGLYEIVTEATEYHQEVLDEVYAKCPEEAKPAIAHAKERSVRGHEEAVEKLEELRRGV